MVGESQGGIVARMIFENCKKESIGAVSDFVKVLMTIGTPNLGLYQMIFKKYTYQDHFDEKTTFLGPISSSFICRKVFGKLGPSELFFEGPQKAEVIKKLSLNSASPEHIAEIQKKYDGLDFFITVMHTKDEMISLLESQTFGTPIKMSAERTEKEKEISILTYKAFLQKYYSDVINQMIREGKS